MKRLSTLMAGLLMLIAMAGCGNTPREQYRIAAGTYNTAALGLGAYNAKKPFPAATWQHIQDSEAVARSRLAEAKKWLADNPSLVNVSGMSIPSLEPANVAIDFLLSQISGVSGVVLVSPDVPATQPQ